MKNFVLNGTSKVKFAKQANRVWQLSGGALLFVTVLLYAGSDSSMLISQVGFRGKYAYDHLPIEQESFVSADEVLFPVITICPTNYQYSLIPTACVKQTALQSTQTRDVCENSIYTREVNIRGVTYPCFTINDPKGKFVVPYPPLSSSSVADQIRVEIFSNTSSMPPNTRVGAFIILHTNTTPPNVTRDNSFIADSGKSTLGLLRRITHKYLSGATNDSFVVETSVASLFGSSIENTEVILSYTEEGYYISTEYYDYTIYNWFGEVGGFACLMLFLHWSVGFWVETFSIFWAKKKQTSHVELSSIQ